MTRSDDDPLAGFARRHHLAADALAELRTLTGVSGSWSGDGTGPIAEEGASSSWSSAGDDGAPSPGPAPLVLDTPRYTVLGRLGEGGQGAVYRVFDQKMQRPLALKVLRARASSAARARFGTETALTVGLEHPGIVPIYDRGLTADGRPWYTMQILDGVEFGQMLAEPDQPLRRRVDVFVRACEAVAFAHRQGVIHRDLKPSNIMIGAFGEVRVLDWGLARRLDAPDAADPSDPAVAGPEAGHRTQAGTIMGTLRYMAPEQLAGDPGRQGSPTDVYALGLILAELLTGRAPDARSLEAVRAQRQRDLPPPTRGPEPLRRICAEATRFEPAARPADAGELATAVRTWLEDAEKRAQAAALVDEARRIEPRIAALRDAAGELDARAAAILDPLPAHAPVEQKRPAWTLSDDAAAKRRAARLTEVELRQTLQSALRLDPDSADARDALTAHYRARLLEAEAAHDADRAAEFEALLLGHDRAGNFEWLRGDGRVTLFTDPPGAEVEIRRYEERDRRLVEVPLGRVERSPIVELPLAMGSYLLEIRHPGRSAVRYPVNISRHGVWDGLPPGGERPYAIPLPALGELDAGECYVPAGWTTLGGDPEAADGLPARRVWIHGFVIDRDPVDHAGYMAWLDALATEGRSDEALALAPAQTHEGEAQRGYHWNGEHFELTAAFGYPLEAEGPVVAVPLPAAQRYASWRAARTGRGYGLPSSWQWEKAARGVDGRHFPWGDAFEVNWANVLNHRQGPPSPTTPGAHPADVSPYGVRGLGGNVRDLCSDRYERAGAALVDGRPKRGAPPAAGEFAMVKGGCYVSGDRLARVATRLAMPVGERLVVVGFRLGRAFGGPDQLT